MDVIGSGVDLSREERFRVAAAGKPFYGPVYFRKGTEPYMTIARPCRQRRRRHRRRGQSQVRLGRRLEDQDRRARPRIRRRRDRTLIAHPDISLVLKKTDLSELPQVAAARAKAAAADGAPVLARDLQGEEVLSANAPIPDSAGRCSSSRRAPRRSRRW
jgi:hypothetical protein